MNAVIIKDKLKEYKNGWVVLDPGKEFAFVAHASTIKKITKMIEGLKNKENLLMIPAAESYNGYVTSV